MKKFLLLLAITAIFSVNLHADEKKPVSRINELIREDIEQNASEIKILASGLKFEDKTLIYEHYSKSIIGPALLNLLPVPGLGSILLQKDYEGGIIALTGAGISYGLFLFYFFNSLEPLSDNGLFRSHGSNSNTLGKWNAGDFIPAAAIIGLSGFCIFSFVRAIVYGNSFNKTLEDVLCMDDKKVSFVPVLNPSDKQYGLVASVKL